MIGSGVAAYVSTTLNDQEPLPRFEAIAPRLEGALPERRKRDVRTLLCAIGATWIVALASPCLGQEARFPLVDVEAACERSILNIRELPEGKAYYARCIADEQRAYDTAETIWRQAPSARRSECASDGSTGREARVAEGYYRRLAQCLERDAPAGEQALTTFRY